METPQPTSETGEGLPLVVGETLDGRFELLDVLGYGGYGVVYKAKQVTTGQTVAVKVLRRDKLHLQSQIELDRFKREMKIIARIAHPHIVRLIDFGELSDGTLYMVIEYIKGQTLSDLLKTEGGLRPREVFHFMRQILDALNAIHEQGVVYRDMKPSNIMITQTAGLRNAVLLDFGVSGISADDADADVQNLTTDGSVRGTPSYMAPEQLRQSEVTPQTDLYAWGLVFIEALTGRKVISYPSSVEVMAAQISDNPVPVPEEIVAVACGGIIQRAVAKPLHERWASAAEILGVMEHCHIDPKLSLPWTGAPALQKIRETADVTSAEFSRPSSSFTMPSMEISGLLLEPLDEPRAAEPPPKKAGTMIFVGLVVLTVAVVVGAVVAQSGGETADSAATQVAAQVPVPPTQTNAAPEKPAANAKPVQLKLKTVPENARITVNGEFLGHGSCDREFPDTVARTLTIEAPGYIPQTFNFTDVAPSSTIELQSLTAVLKTDAQPQSEPAAQQRAQAQNTRRNPTQSRPEPTSQVEAAQQTPQPQAEPQVAAVQQPTQPVKDAKKAPTFEPVGVKRSEFAPVGAADIPDPWAKKKKAEATPDPWKN